MNFTPTDVHLSWRSRAESLAAALQPDAAAADVVTGAARAGLVGVESDLLTAAIAVEAMAGVSPSAAVAYALHMSVLMGVLERPAAGAPSTAEALARGDAVGAIALSSDDLPALLEDRVSGRAAWVAPLTARGVAVIGVRPQPAAGDTGRAQPTACLIALDAPGVDSETVETAALRGIVCSHLTLTRVPCTPLGEPGPFMARVRVLLAAAGLGMGRRAVRESLAAARVLNRTGAGGEQTVQGLLADAATEIDAAKLLTWRAASSPRLSLAEASMAKLASTEATQRAVAHATQVVGGDSFRRGHIIERLAQDVRALELFAGRTEALREAVAAETLPRG